MRINNHLNIYTNQSFFKKYKDLLIKVSIIFFSILVILIFIFIFFSAILFMIVGYIIGSFLSVYLFYLTDKNITSANDLDLKKATKRIHIIHQLIYLITLALGLIIFKTYYIIIGMVIGFLLMKIGIIWNYGKTKI